jgi:diguanylate cyclase (GGDEF)-like protein/PAS domain S-box-containing protein
MNDATGQTTAGNEEQYRVIFNSVGDGIIVCDAETGAFIDVNATACAMSGFSRDELIGRTFDALSPGLSSDVQNDPMTFLQVARSRGLQIFEWLCKAEDGHLFWAEISLRCASLGGRPVGLAILRDITQRKSEEDEVVHQAHFDVLTGLPNRRTFDVRLRQEIARSARYGGPLSVAMGDIDLFKIVNDTHGHQAGDAVLKSLAELMRQGLRESDSIARWGGEEFTLLLPETSLDVAEMLLNRLRTGVANQVIPEIGRAVTLSFGVTAFTKSETKSDTPDELLKRVDQALYRSKQTGRNKVTKI